MSDNVKWDNFSQQSSERDLGLQVDDTVFWVSRRQLANCSPVFNTMLYGEFKESKNEIVKLFEQDPEEILEMLRCLFSNNQTDGKGKKPIDEDNVELMLKLGDEYQISDLMDSCSNFFKTKLQKSTVDETIGFVDLAIRYKMKNIVRESLRRLSEFSTKGRVPVLLANTAFAALPINVRYAVLVITAIREGRPMGHDWEQVDLDRYYKFLDASCRVNWCLHKAYGIYRCTACDEKECGCKIRLSDYCPICRQCKIEYGKTDFVCNCFDPLIEAELEKLGLL